MASLWRHEHDKSRAVAEWITHEFTMLGLSPPNCTPEALARALERERHITIEFRLHASEDAGVYGLLYRKEGCEDTYVVLSRPTRSIALHRLILFHELAHILFHHALTEVARGGALRGYMVSDEDDAVAEAFAVGAMQYSFMEVDEPQQPTDVDNDVSTSEFARFLKRTTYWP